MMREMLWSGARSAALLAAACTILGQPGAAAAHGRVETTGSLVAVSVEVEGRTTPLYRATSGPARMYFEAREGRRYTLRLQNRTGERVAVMLVVDGLNVISGQREPEGSGPGRMYVLGPWEDAQIRGWRTSLDEVREFTFVDEKASYAARSGKMNSRVGWVEARVFRERRPVAVLALPSTAPPMRDDDRAESARAEESEAKRSAGSAADAPSTAAQAPRASGRAESFPGTGWGDAAYDPTRLVDFDSNPHASERVLLRYEYAAALRALGVMPAHDHARDRLRERESGGFAAPPRW